MAETHDPLEMTGRTVIVTGGSKGLGRVIADRFLQQGADVVVCARSRPDEPVAIEGREALFVAADVRDPVQVAGVVSAAVNATGRLDVLVNNAGGAPPSASATVSPRFNDKIIALNLVAPLNFARAVHDQMQSQPDGGVIVNIGSVGGTRANPAGAAYGAAKAGLLNLTETLAHEWGPKIRVVALVVGMIVTEQAHLYYGDEEGIAAVGRTLALERMGTPAEVADVVLFAASPLARWVSGCAIPVHGGGERPSYVDASTAERLAQVRP